MYGAMLLRLPLQYFCSIFRSSVDERTNELSIDPISPLSASGKYIFEKMLFKSNFIHISFTCVFSLILCVYLWLCSGDVHHSDEDEDYSASVSAIMQRRASIRGTKRRASRKSRRASSPMDNLLDNITLNNNSADRRRSSVYTTSSGE